MAPLVESAADSLQRFEQTLIPVLRLLPRCSCRLLLRCLTHPLPPWWRQQQTALSPESRDNCKLCSTTFCMCLAHFLLCHAAPAGCWMC